MALRADRRTHRAAVPAATRSDCWSAMDRNHQRPQCMPRASRPPPTRALPGASPACLSALTAGCPGLVAMAHLGCRPPVLRGQEPAFRVTLTCLFAMSKPNRAARNMMEEFVHSHPPQHSGTGRAHNHLVVLTTAAKPRCRPAYPRFTVRTPILDIGAYARRP